MTRLPVISLGLLSALALVYQLLLMRLFSIIHWHHYAYMVIALALLGHAYSGSMVMVLQRSLTRHFEQVYIGCIVLFSLFCIASFMMAQQFPFNAEEIFWDYRQGIYLLIIFLLLSLPFFFVGAAICLSFLCYRQQQHRLYASDLIGAGCGCLGFLLLMTVVFPQSALFYVCIGGLITASFAGFELGLIKRLTASSLILVFFVTGLIGWQQPLQISPYKSLVKMLLINGTRIIAEKSSPLGLISVLASDQVPIRYVPGMSFSTGSEPLPQIGVFTDYDNLNAITLKTDDFQQLGYLDQMTSALPYHLHQPEHLLIIGSGSGNDVLQAQFHQVKHIDAIELNEQLIAVTQTPYDDFVSHVYQKPGTKVHIADGRDFLNTHDQKFDQIQLTLLDSFNASTSGLYALNENYMYTTEALQLYLSSLNQHGYLTITRWLKMPPRDTLKLFNMALTVLQNSSVPNPEQQLMLIRSWQTATLIIKNGVFNDKEIASAEAFSAKRNFDLVYTPNILPSQVNLYNVLKTPYFYQYTQALLSRNSESFVRQYKFNLLPATDDRPYFQHFFRWSSFPEMLALLKKGGAGLMETGYLIVFTTLCIALVSSLLLILGPLCWLHKLKDNSLTQTKKRDVFAYFGAIGLGFMMIEITFMQKFILLLHHPVYSASASLSAFLVFAGIGSACSSRFKQAYGHYLSLTAAVSCIVALSLFYLLLLPVLFQWCSGFSMPLRFTFTILLIAPLAFFMGMPMPLALEKLAVHDGYLIPWAWGINGCASVISAVLAVLLAMQFGFTFVTLFAVLLYATTPLVFPGRH